MARGKKAKKELTQEEWLEQALVPEEEWPYPIPGNWCWTRIEFCCEDFFSGKSPKYSKEPTPYPIIGQQANQRYGIDLKYVKYGTEEFASRQEDRYFLKYNDVILNTLGTGSIGRSSIYKYEHRMLTDGHPFVFRTGRKYSSDLLYYYFQVNETQIINSANGSTNQKFLSLRSFSKYCIPLPPLAEQKRIVEQIKRLFAKLDEVKEKAQAVVDGFELRKVAILHKAFTGELTKQWRRTHGIGMESWNYTTLSEVVDSFKYGTSEKSNYTNNGMPVLRIPNIGQGMLDFEDMKYLVHNNIDKALQVQENDILVIRSNGSKDLVGKCAIVPALEREYAYASFLIRIKPSEKILSDYLVMYLNSAEARIQMFKKTKSSVGINNINSKELGAITINVPTISEQLSIICIANDLLLKEKQAQNVAETMFARIDTIKKAILARAFRGELGTNVPTEESAITLLRKISEESMQKS